jgi:ribosomal protein S27E
MSTPSMDTTDTMALSVADERDSRGDGAFHGQDNAARDVSVAAGSSDPSDKKIGAWWRAKEGCAQSAKMRAVFGQKRSRSELQSEDVAVEGLLQLNKEAENIEENIVNCSICFEALSSEPAAETECGHFFHSRCIFTSLTVSVGCPLCRAALCEPIREEREEKVQRVLDRIVQLFSAVDAAEDAEQHARMVDGFEQFCEYYEDEVLEELERQAEDEEGDEDCEDAETAEDGYTADGSEDSEDETVSDREHE